MEAKVIKRDVQVAITLSGAEATLLRTLLGSLVPQGDDTVKSWVGSAATANAIRRDLAGPLYRALDDLGL